MVFGLFSHVLLMLRYGGGPKRRPEGEIETATEEQSGNGRKIQTENIRQTGEPGGWMTVRIRKTGSEARQNPIKFNFRPRSRSAETTIWQ